MPCSEETREEKGREEEEYEFTHSHLDFEASLRCPIQDVNQIRYTGLGVRTFLSWSGAKTGGVTGVHLISMKTPG